MEIQNHYLFSPENLKCVEINGLSSQSGNNQKNFVNGLANAQLILSKLEESLEKSNKYELQMFKCQICHTHFQDTNDWWDADISDNDVYESSKPGNEKSTTNPGGELMESWSTMFIICLQHKYEQLSKRYKALLEAYDKRCEAISNRDAALLKMRHRVTRTYSKLENAHTTLLAVGEKYLALGRKMNYHKFIYEEKIIKLQSKLNEVIETAERARIEFDEQLTRCLAEEQDTDTAILLYEIKKCNQLFLENLRLKTQIGKSTSANANWI
ncbi:hypothetical protein K1T71_005994 [Dendrolimus kikuchii]|uniref:Uncharacterized protein n=1 Tax=Dendrolimus kikuchii TaxID=765133 RepID=A0ACC1D2J0_9NEOP|nr:hypothetical protein K1T71_005994 [Dendrolimus kikuchii]